MTRSWPGWAASLALVVMAGSARADGRDHHEQVDPPLIPHWLSLPVEYGDAITWVPERPGPVYRVSGGLLPGIQYRRVSVHLPLEWHYRNPGTDFGLGVRGTWVFWAPAGGMLPLRAVGQWTYLARHQGHDVGGGFMAGLGTLFHVALMYSRDLDRGLNSLSIRIGYDALSAGDPVAAITHFVPQAPPPGSGD